MEVVRGGIDPEDRRFHPRAVGVADVLSDFWSGNGTRCAA